MSNDTTLTIKLPKKLRDDAKRTARELGVPLTTVVTNHLKQFTFEKEIILSNKRPSKEMREAIRELRDPKYLKAAKRYAAFNELLTDAR